MKKVMILVMSVSFLFTACSSDDKGSDSETNGGTEGGVNVKSYGTFTVHTKVDDVDKKLVYWNYLPVTGYDKVNGTIKGVHMEMWDVNYGDTKENYDKIDEERTKVYGELKGGSLLIALNNVEEGLYTITNRFGHFPKDVKDGGRRLAIISVNLGIENEKRQSSDYNDAVYEHVDEGFYVDAVKVVKDKEGAFHFDLLKPIPLVFKEGKHGRGNPNAPRSISVTIEDGHSHVIEDWN